MWLWDLDPGISGAIWNGRDLWLYDMRGGLGTVEGNLDFGILRRTQGIERIRVMMGDQSLWILSDLVEIGNSEIRLLDLGVLVKQGLWIIMIRRIIWKRYDLETIWYQRGVRREQEGPKEEGEITVTERRQRNLHKVENIGEKAVPVEPSVTAMDLEGEVGDRAEIENLVTGLEQAMDLVGVGKGVTDSEPLEFDGTVTLADHKEELLGGDDEFQALTDGEVEETNKLDEVTRGGAEGEEEIGGNGGTYDQMGEEARKKGASKVLFKKPPGISVGTSKMRLVQAVLSPRKTGVSKSTKRQGGGEGAKHTGEKGPSHPKNPKKPDV
ncbi:hypothetical protein HID58_080729 [Brassica napus]|uniref:Uncharacterized protein n=1 Tax=Brassica napus TaxID=3708 RepID=A0ABQ7Y896_BRANA|nr:hypothetical protein HID58_080729 [Brassica napus]